jgi:UDP:flavonoid glycosyltransferase YjiC (YdhE family)
VGMRLLFATTQGLGHVTPLLPFARAARAVGHDVLLAGPAPVAPVADREGLPFHPLAGPDAAALDAARAGLAPLAGLLRIEAAVRGLFVEAYGAAALPGMLDLVAAWRPDAILHETAEVSAAVAGDALGVPTVRVGVALATPYEDWWLAMSAEAVDALRAAHGLRRDPGGARAARTPLFTQAPAALERGQGAVPADVRRFRATDVARHATPAAATDPRPHVPVSFGTAIPADGHYPGLYRAAIDALADLPVRLTVTIGRQADPAALGAVPANVRVQPWVPMAELLSGAAAFVTHGGAGTTLAALAAGVPMALRPVSADQPLNARLVAEHGAGIALAQDGAAGLRDAVQRLLADDRYAAAARAVAREIAALAPVSAAVGEIEALSAMPSA